LIADGGEFPPHWQFGLFQENREEEARLFEKAGLLGSTRVALLFGMGHIADVY
jgi:hypothetical protein